MSDKIKTNKTGVYYRLNKNNDKIFYITYKLSGKSKWEKVGSNKEGITTQYCSQLRAKRTSIERLKEDAPLNKKSIPTLSEAFDIYYTTLESKSDGKNIKGRFNNHIKNELGHYKLDEIDNDILEIYRKKAKTKVYSRTNRPYAPKTINDWLNIIGSIYNHMITKHDMNLKNPAHAAKIEREKVDNDRERYLDYSEIELLWDILNKRVGKEYKEYVTEYMKVFLALSLSTGARLQSVLTITKSDINLNQGNIIIKNHKSNRTYIGFIHPKYKSLIENRVKKLSPIDCLVSGTPKALARSAVFKVFKPIFEEYFNKGLSEDDSKRRVVIHTLRHTFASLLAIEGTPIYSIMKLMDHTDISQTIRYAKLSPDSAKEFVGKLKFN